MGRGDFWDDRGRTPRQERRQQRTRSAAVTGLAIANLLAGAAELVVGLCGLGLSAFAEGQRLEAPGLPGIGGSRLIGWLLVLAIFSWGLLAMLAGIGLFFRGGWARLLTLLLGAFAALIGLLYLIVAVMVVAGFRVVTSDSQNFYIIAGALGALFFLGYGVLSYVVLLAPSRAEEFR